ncbi:MAG: phage tail tube protein [Caulobacteraceae bacterium]
MALPRTEGFAALLILLGNGATPEVFASPAGFTDKSFKRKADTGSTDVPDADDPSLPMYQEMEVKTLSFEVSGSGVLAMADLQTWETWFTSGAAKNIQIQINDTKANGGGYWAGQALLTDFEITAKKGEKCQISVTIGSTGSFGWTAAAA